METITQYTYAPLISIDAIKATMQAQATQWLANNQQEARSLLTRHGDNPEVQPEGPIQIFVSAWEDNGRYRFIWHVYQPTTDMWIGCNSVFIAVDPFQGRVLGLDKQS